MTNDHHDAGKTIEDFGRRWSVYRETQGYAGSTALLADFIAPLSIDIFQGVRVADVGAGNGRFTLAALAAGARYVLAVEPSRAAAVIRDHVARAGHGKLEVLEATGDALPPTADFDVVISLGVIHHIPDPAPVIRAIYGALRPGGKFIAWLYGREGNELYLALFDPLRRVSSRLPHRALVSLAWLLWVPLAVYIALCRRLSSLPMSTYAVEVLAKLKAADQRVVIYDQLNPTYAKYYRRDEALALLSAAPFASVEIHHRHRYGWTVVGQK